MTPSVCVVLPFYSEFETAKPGLRELRASTLAHEVRPIQGSIIANNRNRGITDVCLMKQKLDDAFSHYLFVDSDIGFHAEDVFCLLNHGADIIGAPYLRHQADGLYQTGSMTDAGQITAYHYEFEHSLQTVDFISAGFLLVSKEALEAMSYPWFRYGVTEHGGSAENIGEDIGFCLNARRAGLPIFCDFDRPVYHRLRKAEDYNVNY